MHRRRPRRYNPDSTAASIVSGVLDATSAGILLWAGLVECLAHDFVFDRQSASPSPFFPSATTPREIEFLSPPTDIPSFSACSGRRFKRRGDLCGHERVYGCGLDGAPRPMGMKTEERGRNDEKSPRETACPNSLSRA